MNLTSRRAPRENMREAILAVAEAIVATDGLQALQARRVASEAGCSVGSLYNGFGDLDGLILAVNETTLDHMSAPLSQAFEEARHKTTEARLLALALSYRDFAVTHLARWRAVFDHRLPLHKDLPDAYAAKRAHLLSLIEETIQSDIADASSRSHAARALFAAVHGVILLGLDNKLGPYNARDVDAEIRFIVSAVTSGFARADRSEA